LANLVQTQFPERITLWGGSVRAVIQALLQAGTLDLLYFLGSSGPFESISAAAARSGVTLFYEGQGNGVLIAGYDLTGSTDIHRVASLVVESKVFCNGEMCSSPNVLAVPEACLADYQTAIVEAVAALDRRPSIPHRAAAILDRVLAEGAGSLAVPPGEEGTGPMFVSVTSAEVAMDHELFAPAAFLLPYSDPQRLVTQIAQHRFNLQLTVMTREAALFESILAGTRHARYCWNMFPVDQDLRLPWGNYGKSGYSPLEEIATKVFRPVLVEAGTGLPGPGGHP
jgi:acyl-CoA reductase-like NAD-dependent aldehyde dehydrogenase